MTKQHSFFAPVALILIPFLLTACGFHPVHGGHSLNAAEREQNLPAISIDMIPDREGQILRNELIDRLGDPIGGQYRLTVSKIIETDKELAITKSSEATRAQLRLKTRMTLSNNQGHELLSRDLQALTSYNVLESEFATRVTENAARKNALIDLARQIDLNINLYFNRIK
ncbi:MAG: hypothetical protein KDJ26_07740 [Alphaproteobacteria bacterium]|jgi:LPS-assembly lipoprotein|nr:hypothetical protein [Alphaproteobacteria bacterium]MCB1551873.1 hypothetical protein [Alphaproteobacteria bacterium]MCB9985600.1 hypothetical protein [Micavibrio sp.]HRK98258.1 hypothetical protein [Alphaproteobacteria bacterium]